MDTLDQVLIDQITALTHILSKVPDNSLYGPAKFWETLSEKHTRLLSKYGFHKFKRTVNFEYNQWGVQSLRDYKIKRLTQLLSLQKIGAALLWTKADRKAMKDVRWSDSIDSSTGETRRENTDQRKIFAYTFYCGLLWRYALLEDSLGCLKVCEEPTVGDPLPITYKGKLISQDLAMSTLELNFMSKFIDMSKVRSIAEIGAGYGRLAYVIMKLYPNIEYNIFDIPPALALMQNYLACTLGESKVSAFSESPAITSSRQIRAFLPHQIDLFPDGYFDLVINVSSFDEMAPAQVENYFSKIDSKCSGWLYLQGHERSLSPDLRLGVEEFPYREWWTEVHHKAHPFIWSFVERVYDLH